MKNVFGAVTGSVAASGVVSLARFSYLQLLDLLTTTAFLTFGAQEANPLVRVMMAFAGGTFTGLMLAKLFGVTLGFYCWRRNRIRLLDRINLMYAALVVWNLIALILTAAQRN